MTLGELLLKCHNVDDQTVVCVYDSVGNYERNVPFIDGSEHYVLMRCGAKARVSMFCGERLVCDGFEIFHVLLEGGL